MFGIWMYHKIKIIQNKRREKYWKCKEKVKPFRSNDNTNSEIHNMFVDDKNFWIGIVILSDRFLLSELYVLLF